MTTWLLWTLTKTLGADIPFVATLAPSVSS